MNTAVLTKLFPVPGKDSISKTFKSTQKYKNLHGSVQKIQRVHFVQKKRL
jgi:hypothetical protein